MFTAFIKKIVILNEYLTRRYIISNIVLSSFLFVVLFPFANSINYMQNDEWVHYKVIENFLSRNFNLHPYLGSTFYTQGFIATGFAIFFGIEKIPILTLFFGISNFIILSLILIKILRLSFIPSLLITSLFFFNPLNFYSIFGFMIEEYVLFFILLSLYFMSFYEKHNLKSLLFINLILFLGFFTKHYVLFVYGGWILYLILKREYKLLLVQILILAGLLGYYFFLFPQNAIMQNQHITIYSIFNIKKIIMIGIYITTLLFPLIINLIYVRKNYIYIPYLIGFLVSFMILFYFQDISLKFPYFQNTFSREGYFKADLDGLKYHIKGFYKLFETWQFLGILSLATLLTVFMRRGISFNIRDIKYINSKTLLYGCMLLSYSVFLGFIEPLYDRYFLPFFIFAILFTVTLISKKSIKQFAIVYTSFIIFLSVLSILFLLDYLTWHKYVWSKSYTLLLNNKILLPTNINTTRTWNLYHSPRQVERNGVVLGSTAPIYKYKFSYDSPETINDTNYKLIDTYEDQVLSKIFVNPKIYLYEVINE